MKTLISQLGSGFSKKPVFVETGGKKGFFAGVTLVELLVVIGIIVILSAIVVPGYRQSGRRLALSRSASKLAQDLRRTQEMGMSAREFEGLMPDGGYGIYFTTGVPTSYVLFADCDSDQVYDITGTTCNGSSEKVEEISLEEEISISSLSPAGGSLVITFVPPVPRVFINPDGPSASITLTEDGASTTVSVNKAGLIEIVD